ncbi:MAG: uracil-xanthine permease family protein [Pseudomonadota bacterium]
MVDAVTLSPDYHFRFKDSLLGMQTLLIALGALVMMPLLTGLDPNVALFTAGLGTLIFQVCTKGKIPVFLGSSFAFVAPAIYGIQQWGLAATMSGLAFAGVAYFVLAFLVQWRGLTAVNRILPPIVTGPVIISIGLILAPVAVNMAMGRSGDGSIVLYPESQALMLAMLALSVAIATRMLARGWVQLLPILSGVCVGYLAAFKMDLIDFTHVAQAVWFKIPNFTAPEWNWQAVILIFPVALVSAVEHVGDIMAISAITRRKLYADPGLHRSLLGDGIATAVGSCLGGPPSITYAEVTAGVALTRAFNPAIMTWAAIIAVLLSFIDKVGAFLQTIPSPVMGGLMILLFGMIAVVGVNILVESREDLMRPRAMTIVGLILVIPIGGLSFGWGSFTLSGIGLAGIVGIVMNLILPVDPQSAVQTTHE